MKILILRFTWISCCFHKIDMCFWVLQRTWLFLQLLASCIKNIRSVVAWYAKYQFFCRFRDQTSRMFLLKTVRKNDIISYSLSWFIKSCLANKSRLLNYQNNNLELEGKHSSTDLFSENFQLVWSTLWNLFLDQKPTGIFFRFLRLMEILSCFALQLHTSSWNKGYV